MRADIIWRKVKLILALLAGMLGLLLSPPRTITDTIEKTNNEHIQTVVEAQEPLASPTQITISKINLTANITGVGLGDDGLMLVPGDNNTASWYNPGPRPGEIGNAVLAGHNNWKGKMGVFGNLKNVSLGDDIQISNTDRSVLNFTVSNISVYDTDKFPTGTIYGGKDGKKIILITCHGNYNNYLKTFDKRLVVTATLK